MHAENNKQRAMGSTREPRRGGGRNYRAPPTRSGEYTHLLLAKNSYNLFCPQQAASSSGWPAVNLLRRGSKFEPTTSS